MNAKVCRSPTEIRPLQPSLPEAALHRLRLCVSRGLATGEPWDAALAYGVPGDVVSALGRYWLEGFEPERQPLLSAPWFTTELHGSECGFVHARAAERDARACLLLHGYSGSPAELMLDALSLVEGAPSDACHVVCPSLPGFGLSSESASVEAIAEGYATLMARLGYSRYVIHGSDLGASIALRLAALDSTHVAGVHVTALPAYPGEAPEAMVGLTSAEKSQLARLSELHDELGFLLPETPLEALAFALARLEHDTDVTKLAERLLTGLTLSWTLGNREARAELYRRTRLAPAPPTSVPLSFHGFPLDAPVLRRFAEARHQVVDWQEHERGGPMPGLEQPALLLQSLRAFARSLSTS